MNQNQRVENYSQKSLVNPNPSPQSFRTLNGTTWSDRHWFRILVQSHTNTSTPTHTNTIWFTPCSNRTNLNDTNCTNTNLKDPIQSVTKSAPTRASAMRTRSVSAPRATWVSTARRPCAIRSAWTEATAPLRGTAPARRVTREGTVKVVGLIAVCMLENG